jgi:putative oxidoreductase
VTARRYGTRAALAPQGGVEMARNVQSYWPLPLRILLGIGFMVHGAPKLFSPEGHQQFQGMLGQLGIPAPQVMAWVVGIVEFFGGVALVVGLATSLVAILLSVNMLVALFKVHLPHGFGFLQITGMTDQGPVFGMPGIEVNLLYLAGLLALLIGGPGPLSVDERVLRPESRLRPPWWRHGEAHA